MVIILHMMTLFSHGSSQVLLGKFFHKESDLEPSGIRYL